MCTRHTDSSLPGSPLSRTIYYYSTPAQPPHEGQIADHFNVPWGLQMLVHPGGDEQIHPRPKEIVLKFPNSLPRLPSALPSPPSALLLMLQRCLRFVSVKLRISECQQGVCEYQLNIPFAGCGSRQTPPRRPSRREQTREEGEERPSKHVVPPRRREQRSGARRTSQAGRHQWHY